MVFEFSLEYLFIYLFICAIIFHTKIFPYITYGVVFIQFHWLNQSRAMQNI